MSELAQRVWKRYAGAPSLQIRAVSRFEDLSLEAKPSFYENADIARWKQMEQQVQQLIGQEIRTEIALVRPNRLFLEERSAFGWFRSVCDGKVWQAQRQGGAVIQTPAPRNLNQITEARYYRWLGLEKAEDSDLLRLIVIGSPRLRQKFLSAKEQPAEKANLKMFAWSEPVTYDGMRGQGTVACVVDTRTALVNRVEYRYRIALGEEAWMHIAIVQRWDNTQISKTPPSSRFRFEQVGGATER